MVRLPDATALSQARSRWLKAIRGSAAEERGAEHIVVAGTFTVDPLVPYLGAAYLADGNSPVPRITVAPYDQIFQLCLNWQSMFAGFAPTAIVILWRIEDALRAELQAFLRGESAALDAALKKIDELRAAIATLQESFGGVIIASIPPFPHGPDHDLRAARTAATAGAFHRRVVDHWLAGLNAVPGVAMVDLDSIQRLVGVAQTGDPRKWYLYRQPFTEPFWYQVAEDVCRTLKRQRSSAKKCLIVDCDNTLWGGIVGEDGVGGIALGENFPGSAFRDFQQQLLTLRANGVMLAICSKNNEPDVWEVFERHDGMVLKRDHFVAHRINWQDKPSNIESIARELNIGLDSLVFIDDSELEVEFVRSRLPMVTCIRVPGDVAQLPTAVGALRLFDRDGVGEEDRARSDQMLQERDRKALGAALDAASFRKELQLVVDFFEVKEEHVARVTQLINKTNQFNLTTRRMAVGEVFNLLRDDEFKICAWRVADRFGDYGVVGAVILRRSGDAMDIETFVMSCRVLGRGVEEAVFAALADYARTQGASRLIGQYIPSPKNSLVAELYREHGFFGRDDSHWEAANLEAFAWPECISRVGL